MLTGALLAVGPGPSPQLLMVKDSGARGSKAQGVVCVLKGPLLGGSHPRGWALSSGLLAGAWVWGCRRPSVLNAWHLTRAACAPGHECPGRGPPAAPSGRGRGFFPGHSGLPSAGWCLGGLFACYRRPRGLFPVCGLVGCLLGSENAGRLPPGPARPCSLAGCSLSAGAARA